MTQQEYLKDIKEKTGLTWDEIASKVGIKPRTFKTYRMPESSNDYTPMPPVVKIALQTLINI